MSHKPGNSDNSSGLALVAAASLISAFAAATNDSTQAAAGLIALPAVGIIGGYLSTAFENSKSSPCKFRNMLAGLFDRTVHEESLPPSNKMPSRIARALVCNP